jgi:hypothetical protein
MLRTRREQKPPRRVAVSGKAFELPGHFPHCPIRCDNAGMHSFSPAGQPKYCRTAGLRKHVFLHQTTPEIVGSINVSSVSVQGFKQESTPKTVLI